MSTSTSTIYNVYSNMFIDTIVLVQYVLLCI